MTRSLVSGVTLSLALAVSAATAVPPALAQLKTIGGTVEATVTEVVDGDSLLVLAHIWPGHVVETLIRLDGVQAPNLRGKCAREEQLAASARKFVSDWVAGVGGTVLLRDVREDTYGGRFVAAVADAGGRDLARALIDNGHARTLDGGERPDWCA